MKTLGQALAVFLVAVLAGVALAQTCLVPAPPAPPKASHLTVTFPADGGTNGCTGMGACPTCQGGTPVVLSNAKCAQARQIADQSVANDNGWNDGGAP